MRLLQPFKYLAVVFTLLVQACQGQKVADTTAVQIPAHPLQTGADLDTLINQIGDRKIVLLGEASHGTAEYYSWRAAITKRLIQEKGHTWSPKEKSKS